MANVELIPPQRREGEREGGGGYRRVNQEMKKRKRKSGGRRGRNAPAAAESRAVSVREEKAQMVYLERKGKAIGRLTEEEGEK